MASELAPRAEPSALPGPSPLSGPSAGSPPARPRILVLRTAGTNCDEETAWAFRRAGAEVERLHVGALLGHERSLAEFDILALPGGFSYGDDLGAGTVLANQLRTRLGEDLEAFVDRGRLVIGICNGFQVLVRLGILPGWGGGERAASLVGNRSGRFEDRWVHLRVVHGRSPFLAPPGGGDPGGRVLRLPVAHREGRFVLSDPALLERLKAEGQVALAYCDPATGEPTEAYPANPNGSAGAVAGITNPRGNVLGLMPHPERFLHALHDPLWTRRARPEVASARGPGSLCDLVPPGDGLAIFTNAVAHCRRG